MRQWLRPAVLVALLITGGSQASSAHAQEPLPTVSEPAPATPDLAQAPDSSATAQAPEASSSLALGAGVSSLLFLTLNGDGDDPFAGSRGFVSFRYDARSHLTGTVNFGMGTMLVPNLAVNSSLRYRTRTRETEKATHYFQVGPDISLGVTEDMVVGGLIGVPLAWVRRDKRHDIEVELLIAPQFFVYVFDGELDAGTLIGDEIFLIAGAMVRKEF